MLMQETKNEMREMYRHQSGVLMLSAWGFIIVIASFAFFYVGYWIDLRFGTQPTFMLGLFVMGLFLSVGRLYWEVWQKQKNK